MLLCMRLSTLLPHPNTPKHNRPDSLGFKDILHTPWSARDALRGVWAAKLQEPLTFDLQQILRVYLPSLEALHYEGELAPTSATRHMRVNFTSHGVQQMLVL